MNLVKKSIYIFGFVSFFVVGLSAFLFSTLLRMLAHDQVTPLTKKIFGVSTAHADFPPPPPDDDPNADGGGGSASGDGGGGGSSSAGA